MSNGLDGAHELDDGLGPATDGQTINFDELAMADHAERDLLLAQSEQLGIPNYLPTPEEIRALCAEIRDGWSAQEEMARRVMGPPREVDYGRFVRVPRRARRV